MHSETFEYFGKSVSGPSASEFDKNCHRNLDLVSLLGPNCDPLPLFFTPFHYFRGPHMPFFNLWVYFPLISDSYQFDLSAYIECHLPAHHVPDVFKRCSEPSTIGTVM